MQRRGFLALLGAVATAACGQNCSADQLPVEPFDWANSPLARYWREVGQYVRVTQPTDDDRMIALQADGVYEYRRRADGQYGWARISHTV